MTPTMPADGRAPRAANSFQTRLSEAVSEAVAKRRTNSKVLPGPVLQQIPGSQKTGALRQSSVARTENATAAATLMTPFTPSVSTSTHSTIAVPAANAVMQPADIIANLLIQNPAPTPYAPTWNPSTNPAAFMSDDYNKQGNLSLVMRQINHENGMRAEEYQNGLQNWVIGGMQGPPPAPPHYEALDLNAFNKWWDNTQGMGGSTDPTSTFVSNIVPDAGYL